MVPKHLYTPRPSRNRRCAVNLGGTDSDNSQKSTLRTSVWHEAKQGDGWQYTITDSGRKVYRQKQKDGSFHYSGFTKISKDKNEMGKLNKKDIQDWSETAGSTIYTTGTEWCDEVKRYLPGYRVVKIKGIGSRMLRPGPKKLAYILYPYRGFTACRIYKRKDKVYLSSKLFNGTISPAEAREAMFDGVKTLKQATSTIHRPFRATFRHIFLSKEEFDKKFEENVFVAQSYKPSKKENKVIQSLSGILREADGGEISCGTGSAALHKCHRAINGARSRYGGDFPCAEVFAIWFNYDPETELIHKNYDAWEPVQYAYHEFSSREEMDTFTL